MLFTPLSLTQLDETFAAALPASGWTAREIDMYRAMLPDLLGDINAIGALYNRAIGIQLAANAAPETHAAAQTELDAVEKEVRERLVKLVETYLPQLLTAVLRQMHLMLFTLGGLAKFQADAEARGLEA